MGGLTLLDRLWDRHVIKSMGGGVDLLHIDRHLIHDLEAGPRLSRLAERGIGVLRPDLTFATADHAIATTPGRAADTSSRGAILLSDMRNRTEAARIKMFDLGQPGQGIVHVIGPELGLSLPGLLIVCGDSHTCTHGGLGALAFGIGSSEVEHVLATQTLRQSRPATLRLSIAGTRAPYVTAKDLILYAIGQFGTSAGRGYAIEYAGPAVRALEVEARMTLCNLSIEMGAKMGMIAPDDKVYEFIAGRPYAPRDELLHQAIDDWRTLRSDGDAEFDCELSLDAASVIPQITWGTSPQDVIGIDAHIPDPDAETDSERRRSMHAALQYMGLKPGQRLEGTPIDWVFIGSCTNSRLSDLREAAALLRGRKVAAHVKAWVVPGSENVRRAAEAEGIDRVFKQAGFEWREPGCSLCLAANGEVMAPGERSVSTTNRNFVGRQGPGARTHIASPAMAIAAAVSGKIADVRKLADEHTPADGRNSSTHAPVH
jgi:3-isopropylmalate/(R)-2-methylmalate dehydratase large subunit